MKIGAGPRLVIALALPFAAWLMNAVTATADHAPWETHQSG